jgi:hypothetical protein
VDATEDFAKKEIAEEAQVLLLNLHKQLASKLRDYLSSKLPDCMVPSAYVFLDKLLRDTKRTAASKRISNEQRTLHKRRHSGL